MAAASPEPAANFMYVQVCDLGEIIADFGQVGLHGFGVVVLDDLLQAREFLAD